MSTFLLEVGTEELPADFVQNAIAQWRERLPISLATQFIAPAAIEVYGTPRRLAILLAGLPERQPDREEEIKGPPVAAAFKEGKPTKAAEGFAKKQGVDLEAFEVRSTDKGDFVFVKKQILGRPIAEILTELIPQWILGLEGKRFMRWGNGELRFPRPIRSLVSLLDSDVLSWELETGGETIRCDRISTGHRILHPESVKIAHAKDYLETLRSAGVEVDSQARLEKIREQIHQAAKSVKGWPEIPEDLLEEVANLVEFPTAVVGHFDEEFLNLPSEVTTMVMISHQRYFPLWKDENKTELLPYFITISNGDPAKSEIIAAGNARVIRARLADGQYFYKTDLANPLESYLPKLEKVTFQEDLGSVREKVNRLCHAANLILDQLQIQGEDRQAIERAALLCKADLVTQMVYEFPELQGVMGEKYALASGEAPAVAKAIIEHYLPKGANDELPQTLAGQVVGIADRLDTLVSIFGLGMIPTGSSDPFALRRAANAIINITWAANLGIDLQVLLEQLCPNPELVNTLQEFFLQRIRTQLQDERQIDYDLVNAVLGENDVEYAERAIYDLLDVRDRALFLQSIRDNGKLKEIYETVNRSSRLASSEGELGKTLLEPTEMINPELFVQKSEQAFYQALIDLLPQTQTARNTRNYQQLVDSLAEIAPTVSRFFDGEDSVLVMDQNLEIRRNRLNLLGLLRNHARVLADFGAIVKS